MNNTLNTNNSVDVSDPAPIDVGLGIVLRGVPNTTRNDNANITRTDAPGEPRYEILITRRKATTVYGGYWELPGGKCEAGEKTSACVRRELLEEVGVLVEPLNPLNERVHAYDHATVRLHPWICREEPGSPEPRALEVAEWRWIALEQWGEFRFPEANEGVMQDLLAWLASQDLERAASLEARGANPSEP